MKDFLHVLPRGLFFYQNEFYDAVFGDKTDYPESLKDFLFTRTGDIEAAGEFYGAIEKWPQSVYGTLVEKCNVENRPIPEYENDRVLPLDYHKELLASLKDHFGCGESNYRTPDDLLAARSYGSWHELKRLPLADYDTKQLEDFSRYVFGMSWQTLQAVMEQQKGREELCRKQGYRWKRKSQ